MTKQQEKTLLEFVKYDLWATEQVVTLCLSVDASLLNVPIEGSAGSILDTLGHLLRAEAGFLERVNGTYPKPNFNWDDQPSLGQLAAYLEVVGQAFLEMVEQTPPTQNVHQENETWNFDYHARLIFMSQVYHGIAHRTDITTFLNKQGVKIPELDIWGYQDAFPERFDAKLVRKAA